LRIAFIDGDIDTRLMKRYGCGHATDAAANDADA
jgi:hypothetical protein